MKALVAALAVVLSTSAFAEGGTEAPALSGITAQERAADARYLAERCAERKARREEKAAAAQAAKVHDKAVDKASSPSAKS